jgi:hypothetical protein
MTTPRSRLALAAMLAVAAPTGALAQASFEAELNGYEEVPSVSTQGTGRFTAQVQGSGQDTRIEFELTYSGLTGAATAAHIHFAQRNVAGAVSAFLCGGGDKPACPAEGTVTGSIDAADVTGPEARGLAAGEIEELVRAMQAEATYANVHTPQFPEGEIRGQLTERRRN